MDHRGILSVEVLVGIVVATNAALAREETFAQAIDDVVENRAAIERANKWARKTLAHRRAAEARRVVGREFNRVMAAAVREDARRGR